MPSANVLKAKQEAVAALSEKIKNSQGGVLVDYKGITVEDDTAMRAELRAAGVEYKVFKNSIIDRACNDAGLADLTAGIEGMNAFAISENDAISAAKILKKYADKVESFSIKSGFIEGEVLDEAGVKELADIPSKEVLIGRILGSLQSSLYGFAYAVQAIADKKEEEGESAPVSEEAPAAEAAEEAAPAETAEEPAAEEAAPAAEEAPAEAAAEEAPAEENKDEAAE